MGAPVLNCKGCGKYLADTSVQYARRERDHYCSLECWRKHHPLLTKICRTCGKDFSFPASQLKHRAGLYCSRKCYRSDPARIKTVERICERCGNTFKIYKSQLKHNAGRFCSRQCYKTTKE